MPRTYVKRPKTERICACGCGRLATGRADVKWHSPYCRVKAYRLAAGSVSIG